MHRNSKISISLSFLALVTGLYGINYGYAQTINTQVSNQSTVNQENEYVDSIKLKEQGTIQFTLNKATDKKLTKDDVCILCNGNNEMTINKISTKDNQTYTLKTPYYEDNTYTLSIELPNQGIISREFLYSYDHPTASDISIDRTSDKNATIDMYDVDEGGYIYYKVVERSNSVEESNPYNLRKISNPISNEITNISNTIDNNVNNNNNNNNVTNNNLTVDDIKSKGMKAPIKVGYNEISIKNLKEGKEYDVYYVLEAFDHRISPVYGDLTIDTYEEDNTIGECKLEKVEEVEQNKIILKFNKPVENLKASNISITCPRGSDLTTTNAKLKASEDNKTYTLDLPENYMHKDNKYEVTVTMSDRSKVTSSFISHFDPPTISGEYLTKASTLTRSSEDKINFEFNSDENGRLFYGFYDWNGSVYPSNSNTPQAIDAIKGKVEGTHEAVLNTGKNNIEIDISDYNIKRDSQLWVLYVDDDNNYRTGFVDHYKLAKFRKR